MLRIYLDQWIKFTSSKSQINAITTSSPNEPDDWNANFNNTSNTVKLTEQDNSVYSFLEANNWYNENSHTLRLVPLNNFCAEDAKVNDGMAIFYGQITGAQSLVTNWVK